MGCYRGAARHGAWQGADPEGRPLRRGTPAALRTSLPIPRAVRRAEKVLGAWVSC